MMVDKLSKRSLAVLLMLYVCPAFAQGGSDTLHLRLVDAEKVFLEKNLLLLAERYSIDAAEAQVMQARLYNNPTLALSGNLYNPQRSKFGDISERTGQYTANVQQLILLAGKRNKQIRLAETEVALSRHRFFDLMRTLRFTLRSSFYTVYFLQDSYNAYATQIASLTKLDAAYSALQDKGVISRRDGLRIRSLLYTLRGEQAVLLNEIHEATQDLQILLQTGAYIVPELDRATPKRYSIRESNAVALIDTAYNNRYDLKAAEASVVYAQQHYALQRAMAVPDLTLGVEFDKRGSFVDNATFLNVAFDLPFFNRNQGNIKAARYTAAQNQLVAGQKKLVVETEVWNAYRQAINTETALTQVDAGFRAAFRGLLESLEDNFRKHNVSLLEFTDFNESYKDTMLQLNQLENEYLQSVERLNYAVGRPVFDE